MSSDANLIPEHGDPREHLAPSAVSGTESRSESPGLNHDRNEEEPDRVYPIRSLVSIDPSETPETKVEIQGGPASTERSGAHRYSIIDTETWTQLRSPSQSNSDAGPESLPSTSDRLRTPEESGKSSSTPCWSSEISSAGLVSGEAGMRPTVKSPPAQSEPNFITTRFRHVVTDDGHAVITGRTVDSFKACEDEPIHVPGAIQSFGALIALHEGPNEKLIVRIVSENSEAILGYSPNHLFALESFCDILSDDQADSFLDHLDFIGEEGYNPISDGPDVFVLSIKQPGGGSLRVWCAMHPSPAPQGMVICEFELENDHTNPLRISGKTSPSGPADTLGVSPTPEQLAGSTVAISQPLRVLRNARRRRGEAAAMEVFSMVSQVQDQLDHAETTEQLLDITVGIVKELTGFHRVLVYHFDSDANGKVVAELVDPTMSIDLYKGLHFPASDIPKQARDLYRINKVRLLYDRDQITSRLVCRTVEDLEIPLDMTHAYLRAMSPIHIKYLANMAIRSSMSISIGSSSDLWGLISCHSYGNNGMRVSFPVRKMCRLVGDAVARNIERLSYASRLHARKLINTVPTDANPSGYIVASSDDLHRLFDADYGAICIGGETRILGNSSQPQEMLALIEYLKMRRCTSVLASHHIVKDFKDLFYPPGFRDISGMLYVPLSTDGLDFIVFFRRGQLTEVKWGGNPYEKMKFTGGRLEPRKSFQTWRETVLGRSREWTESEVDTAAVLCLVYGKFIRVWRQKEAALESSNLTKLLLANSAHEVRTPLNAIINYLEIALEGALDSETRDHLTKSYSASKSLIYVINDLLDLTNVEKGQNLIKDELFDLRSTFAEATAMFEDETKRKGLAYTVESRPGIPDTVIGDQRRVRQAISNLISNAVQHTHSGGVTVQLWRSRDEAEPGKVVVKVAVLDTGRGISSSALETLFHELEQVSKEDDGLASDEATQESPGSSAGAGGKGKILGLGLALVARIVRNMHGQLSVKSEEGKGSRFQMSLQFSVPDDKPDTEPSSPPINTPVAGTVAQFPTINDMVLVDNTPPPEKSGADRPPPNLDIQIPPPEQKADETVPPQPKETPSKSLRVLVAEDDPINAKIVKKRLEKLGHSVHLTINGEECAATFSRDCTAWDVILMDIQMPILDGIESTKKIRKFEKTFGTDVPTSANHPVPIFAVSASLLEKDSQMYIDIGFDGWIMKPINFARLNTLFSGTYHTDTRNQAVYEPGHWENGGWLTAG